MTRIAKTNSIITQGTTRAAKAARLRLSMRTMANRNDIAVTTANTDSQSGVASSNGKCSGNSPSLLASVITEYANISVARSAIHSAIPNRTGHQLDGFVEMNLS